MFSLMLVSHMYYLVDNTLIVSHSVIVQTKQGEGVAGCTLQWGEFKIGYMGHVVVSVACDDRCLFLCAVAFMACGNFIAARQ